MMQPSLFDGGSCPFCGGDFSEPDHQRRCDGRQGTIEAALDSTLTTPADVARAAALPDFQPHEHSRTDDPDTSHAAAQQVVDAPEVQRRVLAIFRLHPAGLTDEQLIDIYQDVHARDTRSRESVASPRKRRSDLSNSGLLVDSGARRLLRSGRHGIVWQLADGVAERVAS
jgi:hypothetical protein